MKPDDCLRSLLSQHDISAKTVSSDSLQGFFVEMKEENFAAYDNNVASAARNGDLGALREHVNAGKILLCCNKFKESIIHTICRRGHQDLLRYALYDVDIPILWEQEESLLSQFFRTGRMRFKKKSLLY
jgi:hypothetical protein